MYRQKVFFKTFGCRTNIFDTEVMKTNLKNFDIVESESESDIVVINSCTVTNSADSTAKQYINSIEKLPNKPRVVFTGCGVWTKGESLYKQNKIDALFGHSEKEKIDTLLQNQNRFFQAGDLEHIDNTVVERFVGKSRAFIKIQEGCDFRCNYCIIPFVRGDARSYEEKTILKQIEILASNGFKEFILTGTNLGSYGKKKHTSIAKLLKKISQIRGVRRIRLGSVEPIQIDDEFKEILDEPFMAKHLHIALQHTNKEMLQIMNRRNKVLDDLELFELISSKGYAIGTDFIVGHPGEDELKWADAINNIHKFPLTHIHIFKYSQKDGTISSKLPLQVNSKVVKERYNQLDDIIRKKNFDFRQKQKNLDILIESIKDGFYIGYDQYFNKIKITSDIDLVGNWIDINDYEVTFDMNMADFRSIDGYS